MYSRFKALQNYKEEDLEKLQDSTTAVVGLGAVGSVIADNLARHGVNLVVIDRDYLEPNDCYSSSIYTPEQCRNAAPKAKAVEENLSQHTSVKALVESLNPQNIDLLDEADLIMDGTDNLETRFLISEYCRREGKPWIYTSAIGEKGYSMFFQDKCFNCVFKDIQTWSLETCETAGIMREVSAISASRSSMKAVKFLTGKEMEEELETVEGESFSIEDSDCPVCRKEEYPHLSSERTTTSVCGENKYQVEKEIAEPAFEKIKEQADSFTENEYLIRAELNGRNAVFFRDGRAIIEAKDRGHAEAIYSETVGV
ncbi:MAG: molybdopterin/thiamine biosynthesis adenylyltransferase [Candidatus Nanohaloarchaea archaeon]|jgi:molybdopterin/thiamine biosynthesis adenylyltransferase